jgi:acetyl esterase/lipase
MNTTPTDETILKTDVLGRVRTPRERREQVLDEFERSGLSGQKFAELTGIKYPTFATWAQKRRRQRGADAATSVPVKASAPVRWLEAIMDGGQNPDGKNALPVVLQLPGGGSLEINDVKHAVLAAALLRALEKPAAPC